MRRGIVPDYQPADLQRWQRRLPIRWRLTLMFSGVMAILLAGLIAFIYFHFRSDLDYTINGSLRARAQVVASLARNDTAADTRGALGTVPTEGDNFVQILDRSGQVLGASAGYASPALLSPSEVSASARAPRLIQRGNRLRLYALPLSANGRIVVAGVSLSERDAALDKLDDSLFIGVPAALILASVAAYLLAAAALRPVERMRSRAATISTDEIRTRLPLPESQDEIRRLGETLNEMLDRLEDGLVHERLFVANASHELRMPLAVLRAELEVSLRERGGQHHLRAAMTSAVEETDRIIKLAEDLLLLARAQDGTLPIDPQDLPIAELLADLDAKFGPMAERASRQLVIDAAGVPPGVAIRADPDRLQQAVANLIDNTMRYGQGPITLSAQRVAGGVELHVSDRGAGFGDEFLSRAFDRFSRAEIARGRGGVGLGLAIVRTIAQAHGGDAGAANLPTGGADVWLRLPTTSHPVPMHLEPTRT
ncbi:MAG: ATP-binding protein [Solirubrobacteraceae bacterium]